MTLKHSLVDIKRGKLSPEDVAYRLQLSAMSGFGIYSPIQDRIKLVMNNVASNRELFGIDPSVAKAGESIDVAQK